MRKMLILMLVLGVVPVASAAMILQISVNGNNDPIDSDIYLTYPSGTATLNIHSPNGYAEGDDCYVGLVCNPAKGTISGGVAHPAPGGPAPDLTMVLDDPTLENVFGNPGVYGQIMMMTLLGTNGVFFDDIIFHCESLGDAVVQLITTPDGETLTVRDTVIIHQIVPEPATMVLLGLGGLLFRKRGK